jgi:anti-sigma factor RsiW
MEAENSQLDRQSLLMMYAADELPADQRIALEAQLATDTALAGELQQIRSAMESSESSIKQLDSTQRLPSNEGVAVRRVQREIQQWTVDRLRAVAAPEKRKLVIPWWSYPAAAAAIVIISFLVWSSRQEVGPVEPAKSMAADQLYLEDKDDALANRLDATFDSDSTVALAVDDSIQPQGESDESGAFFLATPREELTQ